MKILHVIDTLNIGGAERVLVTLSNLFAREGHEVGVLTIIAPGRYADDLLPGVKTYCLNRRWKFNPVKMYRLARLADEYDIVHTHMRYDLRYVFLSKLLFGFKAKIVAHDHYGDIEIDQAVPAFAKYILRKVTYVAVSGDLVEWAINKVGLSRQAAFLLSNIVLVRKARPTISQSSQALLMVANIRPTKNIEFALEVMKSLKQRGSPCTLDVVGQIYDTGYYHMIRQLIAEYGLEDRVKLIHDCFDVQEIIGKYAVGIHTAKSESGPLVLIEFLGCGLPFVTFKTGRVVDQIHNELPEFISRTFDVDDWVSLINRLLMKREEETFESLKIRMRDVFQKHYAEVNYYRDCLAIYERALSDHR